MWEPASAPGLELELADQKQGPAQAQQGSFRLLGRSSVDIIKSSGYKLSALEIEREILAHPQVDPFRICYPSYLLVASNPLPY